MAEVGVACHARPASTDHLEVGVAEVGVACASASQSWTRLHHKLPNMIVCIYLQKEGKEEEEVECGLCYIHGITISYDHVALTYALLTSGPVKTAKIKVVSDISNFQK